MIGESIHTQRRWNHPAVYAGKAKTGEPSMHNGCLGRDYTCSPPPAPTHTHAHTHMHPCMHMYTVLALSCIIMHYHGFEGTALFVCIHADHTSRRMHLHILVYMCVNMSLPLSLSLCKWMPSTASMNQQPERHIIRFPFASAPTCPPIFVIVGPQMNLQSAGPLASKKRLMRHGIRAVPDMMVDGKWLVMVSDGRKLELVS